MARMRHVTVPDMAPGEWDEIPEEWCGPTTGLTLRDLMPDVRGPVVLAANGLYLLRRDWDSLVQPDDVIEWFVDQPGDREDFRTVLQVAAVVSAIVPGLQFLSPYLAAASLAYNLLVPPAVLKRPDDAVSALANTSLGGNQARIDSPIWRTYGIDKITPPFAGQPYYEYNDSNDQFFYAVYCGGYGPVDLLADFFGKTPVSHYGDVLIASYLPPGTLPTLAKANVYTTDLASFELTTGRYTGGFFACRPGDRVASIGLDLTLSLGLGVPATEEFETTELTVKWQFEWREVSDAGSPLSSWQVLDAGERTMSTNQPQRWSIKKDLPSAVRVEVRGARANAKSTRPNARDSLEWAGLRAYLDNPAPLNPACWHYEVALRATQQLSPQSQTDLSMIVHGKVRTWTPGGGWNCEIGDWDNYVATRNPAWVLADVWADTGTGEGLADERIDLQTLYDLAQTWDARQDRFDYTFASRTDAWAAGQLIASAGRARMFRRYGVRTLARDELATVGKAFVSPRTVLEGTTMPMREPLPRSEDPDGVIVEYTSNSTWTIGKIECPCPGVTVMERPVFQRYEGIKGRTQAEREGLYHAADMALRTRGVSAKTEMDAIMLAYLLPVKWLPQLTTYGQTGDVAFWDVDTLVMGLTEQPDFSAGTLYLTLRRDDGSITDPVAVLPGPTVWDVTLPAAPDFDLVLDDGTRERPVFILSTLGGDELVKISSIRDGGKSPGGAQYFSIEAQVDDARVHAVDNALLPGPGDVQDPVGVPGDDPDAGGGTLVLVTLTDHYVFDGQSSLGGGTGAGPRFNNDGTLDLIREASDGPNPPTRFPNEWLLVPVDPTAAALFEIYASISYPDPTVILPSGYMTGDTLDTWLNLGTTRSFISHLGSYIQCQLRIRIRRVGETVLQADRTMYLDVYDVYEGS